MNQREKVVKDYLKINNVSDAMADKIFKADPGAYKSDIDAVLRKLRKKDKKITMGRMF